MTHAEHWPLVKVTLADGSEAEVRQFQRDPEELRLINAETTRVEANNRHHSVRARVQFALFDRAKSTAEIVADGVEWAKSQPALPEPQPTEDDERENFSKEWDRRAVVMAAALAVRDYEAPDRGEVLAWALPALNAAATEKGKEYRGNDQIEYNMAAIATLGLIALFLKDQSGSTGDALLRLASHQHRESAWQSFSRIGPGRSPFAPLAHSHRDDKFYSSSQRRQRTPKSGKRAGLPR
jgi:hypothetical protein